MKEYSHQYEIHEDKERGFQFRISGTYRYFHIYMGGITYCKINYPREPPIVVESLTFNGVKYGGDIDDVIRFMAANNMLYESKWDGNTYDTGVVPTAGSYLSNCRKFCIEVSDIDLPSRITEGLVDTLFADHIQRQVQNNIFKYLDIMKYKTVGSINGFTRIWGWCLKTETREFHEIVLDIDINFDASYNDERIAYLEKKKAAAQFLLQ